MSADRQATLKRLLRAIALSEGDFALLLARCNSIEVRDRHITDADGVVNLVDILDEGWWIGFIRLASYGIPQRKVAIDKSKHQIP